MGHVLAIMVKLRRRPVIKKIIVFVLFHQGFHPAIELQHGIDLPVDCQRLVHEFLPQPQCNFSKTFDLTCFAPHFALVFSHQHRHFAQKPVPVGNVFCNIDFWMKGQSCSKLVFASPSMSWCMIKYITLPNWYWSTPKNFACM